MCGVFVWGLGGGGTRSRCFNSGYHDLGLLQVVPTFETARSRPPPPPPQPPTKNPPHLSKPPPYHNNHNKTPTPQPPTQNK